MADQYIKEIMTPDGLRKLRASAFSDEARDSVTETFYGTESTPFADWLAAFNAGKTLFLDRTTGESGNEHTLVHRMVDYNDTTNDTMTFVCLEGEVEYKGVLVAGPTQAWTFSTLALKDVFIAEYGVTSFNDIKTAYDAGKAILATKVDENSQYRMEWYVLANYYENADFPNLRQFIFTNLYSGFEKSISRFPGNWSYNGSRGFASLASASDLQNSIATDFALLTFPVPAGTLCMYNYSLYKANTTVSSNTWDATKWDKVTIDEVMCNAVYVTPFSTPYDDIQVAYDAGNTILANMNGSIYTLSDYNSSQHIFSFSRISGYTWMQFRCWKDQYPSTNDWDPNPFFVNLAEHSQIAPEYSNTSTYEVGDLVYSGGSLYRCTTAISTPEYWNSTHWTATSIDAELRIKDWATSITSFRTGDVIPVDGASGTAKMPKDDLLRETAQNALAGNVAPAFDPARTSENPYKAGESVAYEGKTYMFKVDHYGAWVAADVVEKITTAMSVIDLNEASMWERGRLYASGIINYTITDAIVSKLIPLHPNTNIKFTRATGVTSRLDIFYYDKNKTLLYDGGDDSTSNWIGANMIALHPGTMFVRLCFRSVAGATITDSNYPSVVATFNPYVTYGEAPLFVAVNQDENAKKNNEFFVDLNNPSYWNVGGVGGSGTPNRVDIYADRLYTDLLPWEPELNFAITPKSGISFTVRYFGYASDGSFLGSQTSLFLLGNTYHATIKYFRVVITSITGASSVRADDVASILDVSLYKNQRMESYKSTDSLNQEGLVYNNVLTKHPVSRLKIKTKMPAFAFTFDDCYNDYDLVDLLKAKGIKCGFAFIANDGNLAQKAPYYLGLQNEGFEMMNHSIDGKSITTDYYASWGDAFAAVKTAKDRLEKEGFVINSFVAPSSTISSSYRDIIGKLHAFGFMNTNGDNTDATDYSLLNRYSMQNAHDLQTIKDYVDHCIANSLLCVFYGHARDFGSGDWSLSKLSNIIDYVKGKAALGLCRIDIPSNVVKDFYGIS